LYGVRSARDLVPPDVHLTPLSVMQLDAVWSCVRLIAETIATLPLGMYQSVNGRKAYADAHPLHFIIHDQPNDQTTAAVFWEAFVASMLLRGYGRAERLMVGTRLVGLAFLDPNKLQIRKNADGRKQYFYPRNPDTTELREIPANRIWTVPGFTLNGTEGVSVVKYGSLVFGSALAAERAASKTFGNGMLQTVYYKVAEFLKPLQRTEFKENVLGTIERGETPLLEGGIDAGTIGLKPEDAQLLQTRGYGVEMICRWFRVPPWMVGHTEKSTSWGTGIEQQMIGFLTFTLMPWLRRIEQAIRKDLLRPEERRQFYPKFAVEGLLRADSAARAAFYGIMVDKGILTRDEIRELEEREPMGGNAAVLTVQSAMIPLDALPTEPPDNDANAAREAMRAFLGFTLKEDEVTTP
jgi:HK97 family phage portal protein